MKCDVCEEEASIRCKECNDVFCESCATDHFEAHVEELSEEIKSSSKSEKENKK